MKKKRERIQINKIRNETGELITDTKEIQRTLSKYYEKLYANKRQIPGNIYSSKTKSGCTRESE